MKREREVYLRAYAGIREAKREVGAFFRSRDTARPHQALGCRTPTAVFHEDSGLQDEASIARRGPLDPAVASSFNSVSILSN